MSSTAAPQARLTALEAELADLRARNAELESDLQMFRAVTQTVPVGVALADAKGQIVYGNDALADMVRHPVLHSADAHSYGEWESYHADGRRVESHEYPLARIVRDNVDHSQIDVQYVRGDNTRFWMRIVGEPVVSDDGKLVGAIVATIDIDAEMRLQDEQRLMIAELNHRVKNAFTVSQAIVSRMLRLANGDPGLIEMIDERLKAYSRAHAQMVGTDWTRVSIGDLARDVLDPILGDRITLAGPDLVIPARNALTLSMAFYELATNALKHGSLLDPGGMVQLEWDRIERDKTPQWQLRWVESGGPAPQQGSEAGFGSFVTGRAIALEVRGSVETSFAPTGFTWTLTMPPPHMPRDT